MADNVVVVAADGTGKAIDNESLTGVSTTTYRQRVVIAGSTLAEVAIPTTAAPSVAGFALPVRVAGSISALATGTVTISAMPAISGTVSVSAVGAVVQITWPRERFEAIEAALVRARQKRL